MRRFTILLAASLLVGTPAFAQVEIGTKIGGTLAFTSSESYVYIGVPGVGTSLIMPSLYVTFMAARSFMVEPQVLLQFSGETDEANFSGVLQLGYLFTPGTSGSLYAAANGGWVNLGGDFKSGLLGGGLGYRLLAGTGAAVRVEGSYRRYLCDGCSLNEVILAIGVGGVF
jgi:hypothetical protein